MTVDIALLFQPDNPLNSAYGATEGYMVNSITASSLPVFMIGSITGVCTVVVTPNTDGTLVSSTKNCTDAGSILVEDALQDVCREYSVHTAIDNRQ